MIDANDLKSAAQFIRTFERDNAGRKPGAIRVSKWGRGRIMHQLERMQRVNTWTPPDWARRSDRWAAIDKQLWYAQRKGMQLGGVPVPGFGLPTYDDLARLQAEEPKVRERI